MDYSWFPRLRPHDCYAYTGSSPLVAPTALTLVSGDPIPDGTLAAWQADRTFEPVPPRPKAYKLLNGTYELTFPTDRVILPASLPTYGVTGWGVRPEILLVTVLLSGETFEALAAVAPETRLSWSAAGYSNLSRKVPRLASPREVVFQLVGSGATGPVQITVSNLRVGTVRALLRVDELY